jgi:hypothetical protein
MAESVPISSTAPRLEGVLGPLAPEHERRARAQLLGVSQQLVELSRRLGGRAGWHGEGLELVWMPSGQLSVAAAVELSDSHGKAAAFAVELRPGWFYGVAQDPPRWVVGLEIEVDCQHDVDHQQMEVVLSEEAEASSPLDAIALLSLAVDRFISLTNLHSVEHWTSMGRD